MLTGWENRPDSDLVLGDGQDIAASRLSVKLYLVQSALECLVYGCYMVTFGVSMYVMKFKRQNNSGIRWDVCALVLIFLITTAVTVTDLISNASLLYETFGLGGLHLGLSTTESHQFEISMQMIAEMGFILANFLSDCVLMRRCYIVWNSRFKVILFPMVLSVIVNSVIILMVVLFADDPSHGTTQKKFNVANRIMQVFFGINVIPNLLLTLLIAGRVWWIMRELEKISHDVSSEGVGQIKKRYWTTLVLILESGLLYPAALITFLVILHAGSVAPSLYPVVSTIAGLAPTLIIVRVQLGVSVDSLNDIRNAI
ncbi:hypothetical protein D9758_015889 [Tetrapyrgos nigripes]|uniref:Uncharacterized protein n=1 Tax=Tetrapyrgos nigripes TaxID=182062 RepID=A0A8H5CL85_9AGAR|nr:hypothetical protein D9758_015889 [Tetrapyrgos nigripes]